MFLISNSPTSYEVDLISTDKHEEEQIWCGVRKGSDSLLIGVLVGAELEKVRWTIK